MVLLNIMEYTRCYGSLLKFILPEAFTMLVRVTQQKVLFMLLGPSFVSSLIISYLQSGNLFCR